MMVLDGSRKSTLKAKRKACKEIPTGFSIEKNVDYAFLKRAATASQFTTFQKAEI